MKDRYLFCGCVFAKDDDCGITGGEGHDHKDQQCDAQNDRNQ